ncbi:MAG: DUF4982 domain-containing protein [Prevotellaceae bacterium]|nr:DUF4982 domain-containing protein [Prevotellaceae bacterium]
MKRILLLLLVLAPMQWAMAQRTETLLTDGWLFHSGGDDEGGQWEAVTVPHDWAIKGPFDRKWDLQEVAVRQNGESEASWKTGRTGGLPYIGAAWYKTTFTCPEGTEVAELVFDGAMCQATIYVNGQKAMFWPYGYNSFSVDITPYLNTDGSPDTLAVRLENMPESSRWYPGAGLYRNVHLVCTSKEHIPVWGTCVTTPHVEQSYASVRLLTTLEGCEGKQVRIATDIIDEVGSIVAQADNTLTLNYAKPFEQSFIVPNPRLWSTDTPSLYTARSSVYVDERKVDEYETRFGIRSVEVVPGKGLLLNGQPTKLRGVCLHHDLGPLGAAVNKSAIRHQLLMLKAMGCNAVRTSHNMPAPELVELCDEMGVMLMVEAFDEWDVAKCRNGYHLFFPEWSERDLRNMVRHYRNNPSVVMWSIGNEVPTQGRADGYETVQRLQAVCHSEDPTRLVTCGMDQVSTVLRNGFAASLDIPGLNYHTSLYEQAYEVLPQGFVLGSETSSTVSSRGTYMFPVELKKDAQYPDHQSSGYDLEACSWSNTPDEDFALSDDYPWVLGQFVWTGFDYLGEPSPYDTDAWPSHSSLFGIIDLASLPKDRYYLYRSVWNASEPTLHILPHWTWTGREGERTPVFVYTNAPEAELFVNGVSQGVQRKLTKEESEALRDTDPLWLQRRYRLIWENVTYEPGELRAVAYDSEGKPLAEETIRTAGKPHHLELTTDSRRLEADGQDLAYVTVSVVDKDGNLCPWSDDLVEFKVTGKGTFRAAANGDPTCLELFHEPRHSAFRGQLTAIVQSTREQGELTLTAKAKGLGSATLTLPTSK